MIAADRVKTTRRTSILRREWLSSLSRAGTTRRQLYLIGLVFAGMLLLLSLLFPYWSITLHAPQYPLGLSIDAFAYKLTGDVSEVDGLNHYIGMMTLEDAAKRERAISRIAVAIISALAIASFWIRGRWKWLGVAPVLLYPIIFAADLFAWLYYAGHSLDPRAALSSSIQEFTPRIVGTGNIGQFSTEASFGPGYYAAVIAAFVVLIITIRERADDVATR